MKNRYIVLLLALTTLITPAVGDIEVTKYKYEVSTVTIEPAGADQPGINVVFKGTGDLHYYATPTAAPAPGMELKISAQGQGLTFGEAVFPKYEFFNDPAKGKIEVYVGDFSVYIPMTKPAAEQGQIIVTIDGIACTTKLCLPPFTKHIATEADFTAWPKISLTKAVPYTKPIEPVAPSQADVPEADSLQATLADWTEAASGDADTETKGTAWYFLLAILAGLSINIMPCVLPVIPLIIMRLVSQAKESGPKRVALGMSFCAGIVLFFAAFAALSVIVKLSTGAGLDLNSLYRNSTAVIILFLFIVFFALVLLDILVITLPSAVANKQGGGSGFAGSIGMGFFAGILSTPCSGAVIGAVLVWAQTQPLAISSTALILMGVGMALPYAILISIPKLLDFVPKPGTWMEIFKKTGGFLLLLLAVKFTLTALTKDHLINVLLFGVIFSFCVWMWGTWVTFSTPKQKKWTIRLIALAIAAASGLYLLPETKPSQIEWKKYDAAVIQTSLDAGNPVLLKFTADWCTNCKVVEKNVYQNPQIVDLLESKGIVTIKADTTKDNYPATIDYKTIFKEAGNVPNSILLNPADQTIIKIRGTFQPEDLKKVIAEHF
ncbi:MAG: protein-disulfide reductase DsbD family protein [Planctomycetota bacterium]|jgi:thiol:disulfide interchange protein DsbD